MPYIRCKVKEDAKYVSSSLARFLAGSAVELDPEPEYVPELDDYKFKIIQLLEEDEVKKIAAANSEYLCSRFLTPIDPESAEILSSLPQSQSE